MVAEVASTALAIILLVISAFWLRLETDEGRGNGLFNFLTVPKAEDVDMATSSGAITGNNPEDDCDCAIAPGLAAKRNVIDAFDAETELMTGPSINKTVDPEVVAAVVNTRVIESLGEVNALDALDAFADDRYTLRLLLATFDDDDINALVSA